MPAGGVLPAVNAMGVGLEPDGNAVAGRFVLFDEDTRLALVTSFYGSWDAYMDCVFSDPTGGDAQGDLMDAAHRIAEKIAGNSPTAVQAVKRVKRAVQLGEGQPIEQAIAIMMDAHWRSAVHPDRVEGIGAFNDGREPTFSDPDY